MSWESDPKDLDAAIGRALLIGCLLGVIIIATLVGVTWAAVS